MTLVAQLGTTFTVKYLLAIVTRVVVVVYKSFFSFSFQLTASDKQFYTSNTDLDNLVSCTLQLAPAIFKSSSSQRELFRRPLKSPRRFFGGPRVPLKSGAELVRVWRRNRSTSSACLRRRRFV